MHKRCRSTIACCEWRTTAVVGLLTEDDLQAPELASCGQLGALARPTLGRRYAALRTPRRAIASTAAVASNQYTYYSVQNTGTAQTYNLLYCKLLAHAYCILVQ